MKKSVALLILLTMVFNSLFLFVNAEEITPEIAEEKGFVLYTNPNTNETYYLTRLGKIPNIITLTSSVLIDVEPYNNGTETNFYGVEVTAVEREVWGSYDDNIGPEAESGEDTAMYSYRLTTVNYYNDEEAKVLFADYDIFTDCSMEDGTVHGDHGFVLGDINCTGIIDSRDYVFLKRAYFGTFKLKDERSKLVADVNQNGIIDSRDYVFLKRAYFGTYKLPIVNKELP